MRRMNREIRRIIRIIDLPPSEEGAIKTMYPRMAEINKDCLSEYRGKDPRNAWTRSSKYFRGAVPNDYTTFRALRIIQRSNDYNPSMKRRTIIFWWPNSTFLDVHWKKDPGSIPIELSLLGYDVILVLGKLNSRKRPNGLTIIETFAKGNSGTINGPINRFQSSLRMLKAVIKDQPKAIIIEHSEIEAVLFAASMRLYKKLGLKSSPSLILKLDADPDGVKIGNNYFIWVLYRYLYTRLFDKIVCESECAYNELLRPKLIQKYKSKHIIVPNGFFNDHEKDKNSSLYTRRNTILSVGRIHPLKGHDILIRVFSKLKDKFPDWELRIIGMLEDKSYMETLRKQIDDLNIGNSVKLLTDVNDEDVIKEYKQASIFCLLSRREGYSIARVEAIHYGLPIVITEAGCGIHYKKFGSFVHNIDDEKSILESLSTLMSNADLRAEISEKQKGAVMTWHDVALEFAKLVEN